MLQISEIVKKTEDIFDLCNDRFYDGELPRPAITVSPDTKGKTLGWCTLHEVWTTENENYREINLCAEYLDRPMTELAETMLHEMAHLYNAIHEIEDTSNNGYYHNLKFKTTAEAHGLKVDKIKYYGWTLSRLTPEAEAWVKETLGEDAFRAARLHTAPTKGVSKNRSIKYVCPCCGAIIRATKEVNVVCGDCDEPFEREE